MFFRLVASQLPAMETGNEATSIPRAVSRQPIAHLKNGYAAYFLFAADLLRHFESNFSGIISRKLSSVRN
jgi:hypothetical protein